MSQAESAVTSAQGTSYQGTSYQGTSYQGTSYQGTSYDSTSYQGGSYTGTAAQYVTVTNTELSFWKLRSDLFWPWEQHFPDRICYWNSTRTTRLSCSGVNLATTASPLAGLSIPSTFVRPDGSTLIGTVKIDTGIGTVHHDPAAAMFAPNGAIAANCAPVPCSNPNGCRANCDLWLYNLHLYDTNGTSLLFCPAGEYAMALSGTWNNTGAFSSSTTRFTFACTSGTIAKCTRWGYRPFDTGTKQGVTSSLAPYHQACIRAATADYCANGHSFTKDHTLVDISDGGFVGNPPVFDGFISRTLWTDPTATAYAWESDWDTLGAITMDRMRYQELSGTPSYGSIDDPAVGCPGRFDLPSAPGPDPIKYPQHPSTRVSPPFANTPTVHIDSTPACSHTELQVGRWLHYFCSPCTRRVMWPDGVTDATDPTYAHCTSASGSWDAACVAHAVELCKDAGLPLMATHNECTVGTKLHQTTSGCTLAVCMDSAHASCCTSSWTAACTDFANSTCKGGLEHTALLGPYGFCNVLMPVEADLNL